ncbi:TPA: hypothetical protein ACIVTB_001197, partial [Salmonella enterica subsp. enterica serovar Waycross]
SPFGLKLYVACIPITKIHDKILNASIFKFLSFIKGHTHYNMYTVLEEDYRIKLSIQQTLRSDQHWGGW